MRFTVKKQGNYNWGVYRGAELVEGGFFSKDLARECAASWQRLKRDWDAAAAEVAAEKLAAA